MSSLANIRLFGPGVSSAGVDDVTVIGSDDPTFLKPEGAPALYGVRPAVRPDAGGIYLQIGGDYYDLARAAHEMANGPVSRNILFLAPSAELVAALRATFGVEPIEAGARHVGHPHLMIGDVAFELDDLVARMRA